MSAGKPVPPISPDVAPLTGPLGKVWLVVRPSGERDYMDREPPEGILAWAKGLDAIIIEYRAAVVIHRPPPKKVTP